ncbi:DUF4468 domain-containing protein [Mucilaginibacter pedocola]|nr:DUF4468 domain-containing protein [Mucilaginibacter pedocola]
MKKLFLSIACFLAVQAAMAQKEVLQFDENNKYVVYQVVDKSGMTADTLYQRAAGFVGKSGSKKNGGTVTQKDKLVVYASGLLTKKEVGEVTYVLTIETKDQKYRYKFADFVFKPYKRNRYGNMATQPGLDVPLEKLWTKYDDKETDGMLAQVGTFCKTNAAQLMLVMDKVQILRKPEDNVKRVETDKW